MRRATMFALCAAAFASLLAGCATDGDAGGGRPTGVTTAATSLEPSPATPADDPTDDRPRFAEGPAVQTAKNTGEWDLVLVDVRVAEHEGFDRIVLEFTGTGVPGWAVDYVDEAALDGSGDVVPLDGEAVLDIYASGTTWPGPDGVSYSGPRRLEARGGDVHVYVGGTFEGYTQVLAGIDGAPGPVRVFALTGPSRLVVDLRDESAG